MSKQELISIPEKICYLQGLIRKYLVLANNSGLESVCVQAYLNKVKDLEREIEKIKA